MLAGLLRQCALAACLVVAGITQGIAQDQFSSNERTLADERIAEFLRSDGRGSDKIEEMVDRLVARGRTSAASELYQRLMARADIKPEDYMYHLRSIFFPYPGRMGERISYLIGSVRLHCSFPA